MAIRKFWVVAKMPGVPSNDGRRRDPLAESLGRNNSGQFGRDDVIKTFYFDEAEATRACEQLATQNPLVPYAILAISDIRETGTPIVLKKQINAEGELIPV